MGRQLPYFGRVEGAHTGRRAASRDARVNSPLETSALLADFDPEGLLMHTARDSYADHARRMSGDLYAISESLGHSDIQTTEAYPKSFDRDAADRLAGQVWGSG